MFYAFAGAPRQDFGSHEPTFAKAIGSLRLENHRSSVVWRNTAFDTFTVPAHPKDVRLVLRRLVAAVYLLAFAQSAWAQCAGWQATPEARRQCCQSGACPLHHREDSPSQTKLSQAAADDCCAKSQQHESSPSRTIYTSTVTFVVTQYPAQVILNLAPTALLDAPWETPSPPTHVPKHLLLSVLLV